MEEVKKKKIIILVIGIVAGLTAGGIIDLLILDDEKLFFPFEEVKFKENDYFSVETIGRGQIILKKDV